MNRHLHRQASFDFEELVKSAYALHTMQKQAAFLDGFKKLFKPGTIQPPKIKPVPDLKQIKDDKGNVIDTKKLLGKYK